MYPRFRKGVGLWSRLRFVLKGDACLILTLYQPHQKRCRVNESLYHINCDKYIHQCIFLSSTLHTIPIFFINMHVMLSCTPHAYAWSTVWFPANNLEARTGLLQLPKPMFMGRSIFQYIFVCWAKGVICIGWWLTFETQYILMYSDMLPIPLLLL